MQAMALLNVVILIAGFISSVYAKNYSAACYAFAGVLGWLQFWVLQMIGYQKPNKELK